MPPTSHREARRVVVLVDGEHYPPVTRQAVEAIERSGDAVVAAVFAGGGEKLSRPLELGVPIERDLGAVLRGDPSIEAVVEISDDPVVDHRRRMQLAALALAHGARYEAPGFAMEPPPRGERAGVPTIAVIGTGKRCGKTAVAAHLARTLHGEGIHVVIVAMGRGGPERPVLVSGRPDAAGLLALSEAGEHAASDVYEDALTTGLPVVGARRAGAGPSGATVFDTVRAAVSLAMEQSPEVLVLEGSGTAIPPIEANATVLVARDTDDPAEWPAAHRILLADLVVVRMRDEQVGPTRFSALASPNLEQSPPVVPVALRPTPLGPVEGRSVYIVTTAPPETEEQLRAHLEREHGARVAGISHHLANRAKLEEDLAAAMGRYDVLVCELKAAAVDTAVRHAASRGAEVVFLDNRPAGEGLETQFVELAKKAGHHHQNS